MPRLTDTAKEDIQRVLDDAIAMKKVPALVYGATTSTDRLFCSTAGFEDGEQTRPVKPDSVLWICSQTKTITTIAVFQLIEQGLLSLDTVATDFVPELLNAVILDDHAQFGSADATFKPAKNPILIRHLLNHTSGLFYEEIKGKEEQPAVPYTSEHDKQDPIGNWFKILKGGLPGVPLKFEPGTSFAYGYSTDILGFIVERVTGKSLEDYFQKNILGPLGMNSTSFYLSTELRSRLIELHFRTPEGNVLLDETKHFPIIERNPQEVHVHFGGDGLWSTAQDYLLLLQHLLQILDGSANKPVLSLASLKLIFEPSLPDDSAKALNEMFGSSALQFGYGLAVQTQDGGVGKRKAGSVWWGGWAGTFHFLDPKTGIAGFAGCQLAAPPETESIGVFDRVQSLLYNGLID